MKEIAKEEYTKPYKNEEGEYTLMGIIPWESYWSELIEIMNSDINGDIHKKLKEILVKWKNIGNEELDRVKKEFDEYKKQMEKNAKETVAPIVDEIANTEPGFKAFCLKNKYTFDGFGGNSGRTIEKNSLGTNDWYWDTSSNTFKPY
jgi:gas vesicle protein